MGTDIIEAFRQIVYDAGKDAFTEGRKIDSCLFEKGDPYREAWEQGFADAREEEYLARTKDDK